MPDKVSKFINSLDKKTRARLKKRLIDLKNNSIKPSGDIKKLKGCKEDLYRLRMGKIRIIYKINNNNIEIIDIDYRGNIY